jgi:penicillin-binding protein 1A
MREAAGTRVRWLLRRLKRLGVTFAFVLAILAGCLTGVLLAYAADVPQIESLEEFQPNIITEVYTADGKVLGTFAIERRVVVAYKDIPPVYRNAVVAVEDSEFWKHLGINLWRIPVTAWDNVRTGRKAGGASTLTMQLSRLLFLTPEKTYERKLKEVILAFQIEKNFTKEEIFTFYCNQVYFGHGQYGVEAASQFYFSKSAKELTLTEAAMLAGLPQSPSRLSPIDNADRVTQRRNHVLDRMRETKYITAQEADQAKTSPLGLKVRRDPPSVAPYFLEEVRKYLEREYGSQRIYQGGLRVYTTLDTRLQEAANRALRSGLLRLDRRARGFVPPPSVLVNGALPDPLDHPDWDRPLAVADVVHGIVVASTRAEATVQIGDLRVVLTPRDIEWTKRTNMADALPVGAVAPFTIEALEDKDGVKVAKVRLEQDPQLQGSFLAMEPKTGAVRAMVGGYDFALSKFNRATQAYRQVGSTFKPILYSAAIEKLGYNASTVIVDSPIAFPDGTGKMWSPHNYDYEFHGPMLLRNAIAQSRNVPAVKTMDAMGVQTGIEYARKLGITGELPPYLPIALGAGEATLQEMVAAFATFPNQGLRMKPMLITRITDRDGNVVEENRPRATDAIRADTAFIVTQLLRGVVEHGTAARARSLGRPIAGKTGTTSGFTDTWFVGFEPTLAAGVWIGFDDKRLSLGRGSDGARTALPIWMEFWATAIKDTKPQSYSVPANIVFLPVEGRLEPFVAGTEPKAAPETATTD